MTSLRRTTGFSLIELLVSITIISILISLALPALGAARQRITITRSLSNQKQLLASLSMYASDFDGYFPFIGTPGHPEIPGTVNGWTIHNWRFFNENKKFWVLAIWPDYYDAPLSSLVDVEGTRQLSRYWMTYSAVSAPGYWRKTSGDVAPPLVSMLHGIRHASVRFPSRKGILLDTSTSWGLTKDQSLFGGFADGSASQFKPSALAYYGELRPWGGNPFALMSTTDGVHGSDFK